MEETYWHVRWSAIDCLSPESNQKNLNAEIRSHFFPDQNPHLSHVLQTQKDLGLSELPNLTKCFLQLSVTPASIAFGLKTL